MAAASSASETQQTTYSYNAQLIQINTNLTNALHTFGPSSTQYRAILNILRDFLLKEQRRREQRTIDVRLAGAGAGAGSGEDSVKEDADLDPEVLSVAMGFLEIGS